LTYEHDPLFEPSYKVVARVFLRCLFAPEQAAAERVIQQALDRLAAAALAVLSRHDVAHYDFSGFGVLEVVGTHCIGARLCLAEGCCVEL